jgi:WXG100 family type VII secretion target
MPNQFNHDTVKQYGGVAWAKEQVNMLDPGAIDTQIQGYNQVKGSLNQIVDTLNNANASIQSAWSGDAATAASQTFTDTSNHAQNVVSTVDNTITQLQTAKTAAATAKEAMQKVPDEKPVPSGGFFSDVANVASDIFTGTDPKQQAEQHNTAARTQAADVLNKLSDSYDSAANNMNSIAGSHDTGFTATSPSQPGGFNLGSGSYGGGPGTAASYTSGGMGSSGGAPKANGGVGTVQNGVFDEKHTNLSGTTTLPTPETTTSIPNDPISTTTTTTTPEPPPNGLNFLTEPPSSSNKLNTSGGNAFEDNAENGGGRLSGGKSKLGSSNVFGEDGFEGENSGGPSARRTSNPSMLGDGEGEGTGAGSGRGGAGGPAEGEEQAGMRGGMGGRRGGGAGGGEEELGSSKYSRGRFFGDDDPRGGEEWVQPSVGGNESLLVKGGGRGSGTGRVTSAYDGATDVEGNPLHMFGGAGRRGVNRTDDEDERGERPDYLKEDPEWWQSAQRVAPPVVE